MDLIAPGDAGRLIGLGEAAIGGKAAGLARLLAAGARVPPFFVVLADAFTAHTAGDAVAGALATLRETSPADPGAAHLVRDAVVAAPLDARVREAVGVGAAHLGGGPFAVRSSMVGEDAAAHSFAGQLDSVLNVAGRDSVLAAAILTCWASAYSDRAVAYRAHAGIPVADVRMGVVVQEMVAGDVSGVLFTANPVTRRRHECLLSATWGLGEGVVSGACDADEYVWADGGERSARVPVKETRIVPAPDVGTAEEPVADPDRERRCLAPRDVDRVCSEGVRLAGELGGPLDVEWTLRGGDLFVLQARPVTSRLDADEPLVVWDNSNIQESYCGVTTPLTFSFASRAYATVYEQTMRMAGLSEEAVAGHRPVLENLLGLVQGRVYYNINNWYRCLLLMPTSFGRSKEDMEAMMGLEEPVDFVSPPELSAGAKVRRLPGLARLAAVMVRRFAVLDRDVGRFLAHFDAVYASVDRGALAGASYSELVGTLDTLRRELLERWTTPIVNDARVMMTAGSLRRALRRLFGDEAAVLQNDLMSGEEGLESVAPTRMLLRIAAAARRDPATTAALRGGPAAQAYRDAVARGGEVAEGLREYVERYGDRVMGELKLETVTLREDPGFVVEILRNYLDRPDLDPDGLSAAEHEHRRAAEARVRGAAGALGWARLKRKIVATRAAVKNREAMRLSRTRMFGLYRDTYLAIGRRLVEAGRLESARDVFYLTVEEIEAFHDGRAVGGDLAGLVRLREAEFAAYEKVDLPHRIVTRGAAGAADTTPPGPSAPEPAGGGVMRGTPCYPGVVESAVQVVTSPQDSLSVNGRILVAVRTDPGWAPLFPTTSGILVERGSTLSHSAVVARELGIPAIVGVPDVTRILRSGDFVRMDGGAGTVERIDGAGEVT